MSGTNGHGGPGAGAAVTAGPAGGAGPLPSQRDGGERPHRARGLAAHPRSGRGQRAAAPTGEPPAGSADAAGLTAGEIAYQEWGWPVTRHRDQVRLSLHRDVSALVIPIPLSTEIREILTQRRCAPPVLAHPYTPDHHIMLFGERYGVTLPWPSQVHQVTGTLLLPPTVTPRGPITWSQPPRENSLRLCREIDLFGALRTVLNDLNNHR